MLRFSAVCGQIWKIFWGSYDLRSSWKFTKFLLIGSTVSWETQHLKSKKHKPKFEFRTLLRIDICSWWQVSGLPLSLCGQSSLARPPSDKGDAGEGAHHNNDHLQGRENLKLGKLMVGFVRLELPLNPDKWGRTLRQCFNIWGAIQSTLWWILSSGGEVKW